jgi:hypothetical protein
MEEPKERNFSVEIPEELKATLQHWRDAFNSAAKRPDAFYRNQHSRIVARINGAAMQARSGPKPLWAPAGLAAMITIALLCLFLFVENGKAPTPDLAAGSDQQLLIEVERALEQDYPEPMAPAALLSREIEQAIRRR